MMTITGLQQKCGIYILKHCKLPQPSYACKQLIRHCKAKMDEKEAFPPEFKQRKIGSVMKESEASLYVHWPYCERRCSYCNFNKYINRNVDHVKMARCLSQEAKNLIAISGVKKITSIFFGGGTPSLATPNTLEEVINTVAREANLEVNAEITMEANPTSLEKDKLKNFKAAGINRLSLGIQSLNNHSLKLLNRGHSASESLECLKIARKLFPGKVSVDLIFGLPGQSVQDLGSELNQLLELCDEHLSLYQLTLERGTSLFKQVKSGNMSLPNDDVITAMYTSAVDYLENKGYARYEVSNFAKRREAESSHNKSYWRGQSYIGIGPGAHGRFIPHGEGLTARQARVQTLEPEPWMWEVEHKGHATRKIVTQTKKEVLEELLTMGIRTAEGISEKRWTRYNSSASLSDIFLHQKDIQNLAQANYLIISKEGLKPSKAGLNVADMLAVALIDALDKYHVALRAS